jgi:hypothetical protein
MVLSAEVFRPDKPLSPRLDLGRMQRHALSVAAIARALAADAPWAEDAPLAGLLHDVGPYYWHGRLIAGRRLQLFLVQSMLPRLPTDA